MQNPPNLDRNSIEVTLTGAIQGAIGVPAPGINLRLRVWGAILGYSTASPAFNRVRCTLTNQNNTALVPNWYAHLGLDAGQATDDIWISGGFRFPVNQQASVRFLGTAADVVAIVVLYTTEAV